MSEDEKDRVKRRFLKICSNLVVEGHGGGDANQVTAEAVTIIKASSSEPKYFGGDGFVLGSYKATLEKLDAIGAGLEAPAAEADDLLRLVYSDFVYLCIALKPSPSAPATSEDPNFDASRIQRLFDAASEEAQAESLQRLGRLIDSVIAEGIDELASSPAKLRVVVMALAHPLLVDPTMEPWEVLKKFLALIQLLHAQASALATLVRWFASLPLPALEQYVNQVQTFVTLSLLMAQSEHGFAGLTGQMALRAVDEIAKSGGFASHIRNALRLLDALWRANERRKEHGLDWRTRRKAQLAKQRGEAFDEDAVRILEASHFHNDAVNDCEEILKHDLRETLESQPSHPSIASVDEAQRKDFGLAEFPFILTAVSKVKILTIESLIMQREEVRSAMAYQILRGRLATNPFLVLKVRRREVIQDSLQQLAQHDPDDFKKPLKIVFDGEEGVDEGGVQKEFFQLLIEELYKPDFGMFEHLEESRNFWFNKNSFEANLQFQLFGIVLGLAIYNQVILDVKFPKALYKKLMSDDVQLGLSELLDFQPSLAQGLMALLEFDPATCETSFEDFFGPLRFVVEYECYGSMVEAELKEGGKDLAVSLENREEYIQRYCDWIFSTGVAPQYKAFRKGFDQCISDTLFRQLFTADELELVICGTMELDFEALEKVSQYQDGYTKESPIILWFWQVVHALSPEEKKLFLQFCTGCDRAPVGGLGRLPFIVSRAGPDSSTLPTVHTCFNHILVPEYESKEKLEKLLGLAIQHSTGFGLM